MISLLTYIAIILGVIAIARLVKVYELSTSLKGTDNEDQCLNLIQDSMEE